MEAVRFDDEMVRVELVADVPFKDDCRAHTPIVWNGKGDIKPYPKRLVKKLLPHPDVWRVLPDAAAEAANAQRELEAAEKRLAEARTALAESQLKVGQAALQAQQEAEAAEAARLQREKQEAAGANTDVVTATVPGAAETEYTIEEISALPDDDLKAIAARRNYGLHPRLNPENLRLKFLEAQDAQFEEAGKAGNAST